MKMRYLIPLALIGFFGVLSPAVTPKKPVNKLLFMYRFFYLPFSVEFQQGRTPNDILPLVMLKGEEAPRLITADELLSLDRDWKSLRTPWQSKSLIANTQVALNQTVKISSHMSSHRITLSRGPFDTIALGDRIQLQQAMVGKSEAVQASFKQVRHLKSFLAPYEEERLNFFVFSPSWCESSREYRVLFESYFKQFPEVKANYHSVVIDDPKEEIFDSRLLKELFPHPEKYSHDSVPRFLAMEVVDGKTIVYEEGAALEKLYEAFKKERGYLDQSTTLFGKTPAPLDRKLSSITK